MTFAFEALCPKCGLIEKSGDTCSTCGSLTVISHDDPDASGQANRSPMEAEEREKSAIRTHPDMGSALPNMLKRRFRPGDVVVANHSSPYGGEHGYVPGDRFTVEAVDYDAERPVIRLADRPDGIWSGPGGFDLVQP